MWSLAHPENGYNADYQIDQYHELSVSLCCCLSVLSQDALPEGSESLSQLGLCGGDTLWVISSPGPVSAQSGAALNPVVVVSPAPAHSVAVPTMADSSHWKTNQALASHGGSRPQEDLLGGSKRSREAEDLTRPQDPHTSCHDTASTATSLSMGGTNSLVKAKDFKHVHHTLLSSGTFDYAAATNTALTSEENAPCHEAPCDKPPRPFIPCHLMRTLSELDIEMKTGGSVSTSPLSRPHNLLMAAAHACMLETGFVSPQASSNLNDGEGTKVHTCRSILATNLFSRGHASQQTA